METLTLDNTSTLDKIFNLIAHMETEFPLGCQGVQCEKCPLNEEIGANGEMCNVLRWMIKK